MIRLIGIDVDGTLVGASGSVSPAVWAAAEKARAAGIHLALCSGRPAFGISTDYASRLDPAGWHVFQNGASIVDFNTGSSRSTALPPGTVDSLVTAARRTRAILELYSDREYANESPSAWAKEHAALLGVPFQVRRFESLAGPVVRGQWLLPKDDADDFMAQPQPGLELATSTSPLMPDTAFVGITAAGVSKGSAMQIVAAAYGVEMRDVMYVGDADNDLSALKVAGHPIAMANASSAALKAAARTVGHVDEGGLAEALEIAIASTGTGW